MATILLTISGFLILAFIVVAMYCAMVVAGRSDEQANMENNKGDDDMFFKKQICPRCKTGKYTYELDPKSECCPYIGCWRRNKCHFYKPLEKSSKKGFLDGFLNKQSVTPPPKNSTVSGLITTLKCTSQKRYQLGKTG